MKYVELARLINDTGDNMELVTDLSKRLHHMTKPCLVYPPFEDYPDGLSLYYIHGINVPEDYILHPELITVERIDKEENQELRRCMLEIYTIERYLTDSKDLKIRDWDKDQFGRERKLVQKQLDDDTVLTGVFVKNSTPEGHYENLQYEDRLFDSYSELEKGNLTSKYDGTDIIYTRDGQKYVKVTKESGKWIPELDKNGNPIFKDYFILVNKDLRPMIDTGKLDDNKQPVMAYLEPQPMTCHNAISSTFGLYGDEYCPDVET